MLWFVARGGLAPALGEPAGTEEGALVTSCLSTHEVVCWLGDCILLKGPSSRISAESLGHLLPVPTILFVAWEIT